MVKINYVKICDYISKNPKKSTKNCKLELMEILHLKNIEEVEQIIAEMIYKKILKEKKIRWRGMFYPIYIVDLSKLG